MTEEQMRQRMKEIDVEREKLKNEKKQYEDYFYNNNQEEKFKNHKEHIGKCYVVIDGIKGNINKHIKAFKVINILEPHHENYALCVTLINGYRYTCWNEYGVQLMTLGLWNPNINRMVSNPNDPKMIDFYKEITQEEFEQISVEYLKKITDEIAK